jgi:hypothetical protein
MIGLRRQLTLFVPPGAAPVIDDVRRRVDPVQFGLIAAHVTLCREDEFGELSVPDLRRRLAHVPPLTLVFGAPTPFAGHGMLLPCIDGAPAFHALRAAALGTANIRVHEAHITLAHPRNPIAAENVPATYGALPGSTAITFPDVALIEQRDAQPWERLGTVALEERVV